MKIKLGDLENGRDLMCKECERFLMLFEYLAKDLSDNCDGIEVNCFPNEMNDGRFVRTKNFALGCHYFVPFSDSAKFSSLTISMYDTTMINGEFVRKKTEIDNQPYELYLDADKKLYWRESNTSRTTYYTSEQLIHHWKRVFVAIVKNRKSKLSPHKSS